MSFTQALCMLRRVSLGRSIPSRMAASEPSGEAALISVTPKGYSGVRLPGLSSPGGGSSRAVGGADPDPRLSGLSSPGGGSSLSGRSPPGGEAT